MLEYGNRLVGHDELIAEMFGGGFDRFACTLLGGNIVAAFRNRGSGPRNDVKQRLFEYLNPGHGEDRLWSTQASLEELCVNITSD